MTTETKTLKLLRTQPEAYVVAEPGVVYATNKVTGVGFAILFDAGGRFTKAYRTDLDAMVVGIYVWVLREVLQALETPTEEET
ncbi:MAG: hypothetical protein ACOH10_07785 [Rhodoglobus sp.]